jgi:hypothetical protein
MSRRHWIYRLPGSTFRTVLTNRVTRNGIVYIAYQNASFFRRVVCRRLRKFIQQGREVRKQPAKEF